MAKVAIAKGAVERFLDQVQAHNAAKGGPSEDEKIRDAITAVLGELGALTVREDSLIFEGEKFILPKQYQGKVEDAIKFLQDWVEQQEQEFEFGRTFRYRPWDGANAFNEVLKAFSGTTGFGVTKMSFFGPVLPSFETINISATKTVQVPVGTVAFPPYEAEFNVTAVHDRDFGSLFRLEVEAPRRWRQHIEAIFTLVEEHLRTHSIYRGQAITGAEVPEFLTLAIDPQRVIYSEAVLTELGAHLWTPLEHAGRLRELGVPLKRTVLLEGPYGSGKTLAGMLTAQRAVANGWTFIQCRPGRDDPATVLKTAQLYAPAVVWIEDIEVHASEGSAADISRLLEMLDGVTNKGVEVMAGFTTNHVEKIQRGALRPGRIDAIIRIDGLDGPALRKLVAAHIPPDVVVDDIDFDQLAPAFKDFQPAFAVEAITRALRFSLHRNGGGQVDKVTTEDLVNAAEGMRRQLELMDGANEGPKQPSIDEMVRGHIDNSLGRTTYRGVSFEVHPPTPLTQNGKR